VTRACPGYSSALPVMATLALRRRMIEEVAEGEALRLQQMW
jgi:hypothetical protein